MTATSFLLKCFAGLLIIITLFLIAAGISGGLTYLLAPFKGAIQAEVQIESGANRRYTYDHFHNMCAAIKAIEIKIDTQQQLLSSVSTEDQRTMILTNIAGLSSQRASKIAEYNADSEKAYTSARFKDDRLPRNIPLNIYDKTKTQC